MKWLVGLTLQATSSLFSITTTWTPVGDGAWGNAGNWDNGVPTAGDDAQFDNLGIGLITINLPAGPNTLVNLTNNSPAPNRYTITTGTIDLIGEVVFEDTSLFTLDVTISATTGTPISFVKGGFACWRC